MVFHLYLFEEAQNDVTFHNFWNILKWFEKNKKLFALNFWEFFIVFGFISFAEKISTFRPKIFTTIIWDHLATSVLKIYKNRPWNDVEWMWSKFVRCLDSYFPPPPSLIWFKNSKFTWRNRNRFLFLIFSH